MKRILVALMALMLVGMVSCKKEKDDTQQGSTTTTTTPQGGGGQEPVVHESFVGDWNLVFSETSSVHLVVDFGTMAETMLQMQDIDREISFAGKPMALTITDAGNGRMTVSGSLDIQLTDSFDPVTLPFSTTATLTDSGLNIDPAVVEHSVDLSLFSVDLSGTVTFEQPTAFPDSGELTLVISNFTVGSDASSTYLTMTASGEQLQAVGTRSGK